MKFKIYSRKSVFTGKGESIENQVEMCRQYILANFPGSTEADMTVYEDEGFSGKNLDRPQFQKMMRDIRADKPDCLVCYRLDRISRNVSDFAALIESLNDQGIAFVCIREKFDTGTPMGKAMMYIASVFAQLERETIAERVRDNMLMLAKTGRWLGGTTPTGYLSEKTQEIIIDGKVKSACKLKVNPDEIVVVDMIFRKFLELQSMSAVRKYLHEKGFRSRSGKDHSLLGLKEILQNPVYCIGDQDALAYFVEKNADVCFTEQDCGHNRGLLSYNKRDYTKGRNPRNPVEKWIIAIGKHEGRVSGKDWVTVQRLLELNKPDSSHSNTHNDYALLSGLIFCARCGRRMFAKIRNRQDGRYDYICQKKMQLGKEACDCPNLLGAQTDETVCRYLRSYARPDSKLKKLLDNMRAEFAAETNTDPAAGISKRIEECHRELERLVAALGNAEPDGMFARKIRERVSELEAELHRLEYTLAQTEAGLGEETERRLDLDAFCTALLAFADRESEMTVREKRALIRLLVQKCEWDGEKLHIFIYGE